MEIMGHYVSTKIVRMLVLTKNFSPFAPHNLSVVLAIYWLIVYWR